MYSSFFLHLFCYCQFSSLCFYPYFLWLFVNPLRCKPRLRLALLWGDKSPVVASNALFALPPFKWDSFSNYLCNANLTPALQGEVDSKTLVFEDGGVFLLAFFRDPPPLHFVLLVPLKGEQFILVPILGLRWVVNYMQWHKLDVVHYKNIFCQLLYSQPMVARAQIFPCQYLT